MRKVLVFSLLLVAGLVLSQVGQYLLGDGYPKLLIDMLTMTALAFVMIRVGEEFSLDKSNLGQYAWDYFVAMTAAAFPWVFCALYFVYVMSPQGLWDNLQLWKESLLESRFASPTSAGVLFTMLAAAGLSHTWVFSKARLLAIFDDLDTILFLVLLQVILVGMRWQLFAVVVFMVFALAFGWAYQHRLRLPRSWPWVIVYSALLTGFCEWVLQYSKTIDKDAPIHLEVLLPAFVLGWALCHPEELRRGNKRKRAEETEEQVSTIVAAAFLFLVGLSMPPINSGMDGSASAEGYLGVPKALLAEKFAFPGWGMIALHVLNVTLLSNLGKMFPFVWYLDRPWRERLALSIGMFPRGEVGAGVLVISLAHGLGGPALTVAMLSLALNLVGTGLFVLAVKRLLAAQHRRDAAPVPHALAAQPPA